MPTIGFNPSASVVHTLRYEVLRTLGIKLRLAAKAFHRHDDLGSVPHRDGRTHYDSSGDFFSTDLRVRQECVRPPFRVHILQKA